MYIYEMPFRVRNHLCRLMDSYKPLWINLAAEIGLKPLEVSALDRELLRPDGSPTDKLLSKWGHSNATVDMLAYKLISINALSALEVIRNEVSPEVLLSVDKALSLSPSDTTTEPFSLRKMKPIISDENLPIPCPDKKDENHEMKQNYSSNQYSLDIKDERMKRMSIYPLVTISAATNNFSKHSILRKGKSSTTYKGIINQEIVAIKALQKMDQQIFTQTFYDEIDSLLKHPHQNLVGLLGISQNGPNKCFVYEYLENGSLRDRLLCEDDSSPLTWIIRHSILKDASQGLLHLHTMLPKPIIHKNIKSSNILLDINFTAKLGDFGFLCDPIKEREIQQTRVTKKEDFEQLEELQAYMPDDFFRLGRQHTLQTDIYSFGMVILEICTGLDAIRWMEEKRQTLAEFTLEQFSRYPLEAARLISLLKDGKASDWDDKLWMTMLMLGNLCTNPKENKRLIIQHVCDATEKSYGDVIGKLSSQIRENIEKDIKCNNIEDNFRDSKAEGNFTKIISEMKTACLRNQRDDGQETDIYSSSLDQGHDLNLGYPNESEDQMAMSEYVSINEDIDMMKAKKPFSNFCFDPELLKDAGLISKHPNGKHFFKSDCPYDSGLKDKRDSDDNNDNKLDTSFSKECSDNSNVCQLSSTGDSSDLESLIKKLLQQDQERFAKLENLKKEFPNEF